MIQTFTRLFSGHADYAAAGHAANPRVPWLGMWFVLAAPVLGGLLYGPLVDLPRRRSPALADEDNAAATVGDLAELLTPVAADESLADALHRLVSIQGTGLPTLDVTKTSLVGWITDQGMLTTLAGEPDR